MRLFFLFSRVQLHLVGMRIMPSLTYARHVSAVTPVASRCASGASATSTSASVRLTTREPPKRGLGVGCRNSARHHQRRRNRIFHPRALDKHTSDAEWRYVLDAQAYAVLREAKTEAPYSGEYNHRYWEPGHYRCRGCRRPLFDSSDKFHAHCGWPAFYRAIPGAVEERPDPDGKRTEIRCGGCGGHLGHVFKGEPFPGSPTDVRHCVNSAALWHEVDAERKAREEEANRASGW